ncbi:MAG TPA: sigma-70 domain-containing protein [Polyangiaceae bacterium]|nr:sigma-70 domain-containing protein [Polyangiaceae bacterium]
MRAELVAIAEALLRRDEEELSLDVIAEALGTLNVDSEEIDGLFAFLEERGRRIGEGAIGKASASLADVLRTARALRASLGRTPSVREIAEQSGVPVDAVRRALLFSQIVQR